MSRPPAAPASPPGSYTPHPGAAALPRMILSQARLETRLLLRNGEQLLIVLVIPVLVLLGLGLTELIDAAGRAERLAVVVPGVLALCILSTAFTSLAIATGFERRYGALKRLGASPLPRSGLLAGKTLSVLLVEVAQLSGVLLLALGIGWRPAAASVRSVPLPALLLAAAVLLVAGTAAFAAIALLMAGTLRAEATLAAGNLVYLLLLAAGGIAVPTEQMPAAAAAVVSLTPSAALADGLREMLRDGQGLPLLSLGLLLAWALAAGLAAARWFRWE